MLLTVIAAGAVAYGTGTGAHVSVNVIKHVLGRTVTRWTDALMRILAAAICAVAAFALFDRACGIEKACITENLSVEHEPFYYVLSLALAVMAFTYAVQFAIGLAALVRRRSERDHRLMDGSMVAALGFAALFFLLFIRMPVGLAMMLVGTIGIYRDQASSGLAQACG